MNQTLLKKQTKADSFLDFRWLCHWYQGFPCLFIECCFHAYVWCAFSLRRLRLTQGRQDTPSPKYENNIPWTATEIPDINTLHSLSHNLCLRYLDFQKLYNICTIGAHVGRFDLSPPLRPEKGVGGTRALAHSISYIRQDFRMAKGVASASRTHSAPSTSNVHSLPLGSPSCRRFHTTKVVKSQPSGLHRTSWSTC